MGLRYEVHYQNTMMKGVFVGFKSNSTFCPYKIQYNLHSLAHRSRLALTTLYLGYIELFWRFIPSTDKIPVSYSTLANWTMTSSFPMLGTLFVPYFLFGRLHGSRLIRTETPIDAFVREMSIELISVNRTSRLCSAIWAILSYRVYIIPHFL